MKKKITERGKARKVRKGRAGEVMRGGGGIVSVEEIGQREINGKKGNNRQDVMGKLKRGKEAGK